jgi:nucleotide-binding universal stress UspA family protein
MGESLTRHLVVPVASDEDARETASLLQDYEFDAVTVVQVVEKAGGAPDKLSVEQAEEEADASFAAFRELFPDAGAELAYHEDIVEGINQLAEAVDASAIAFRPRGGSRLVQFLSGDTALKLVTEADRPVIALPEEQGQ